MRVCGLGPQQRGRIFFTPNISSLPVSLPQAIMEPPHILGFESFEERERAWMIEVSIGSKINKSVNPIVESIVVEQFQQNLSASQDDRLTAALRLLMIHNWSVPPDVKFPMKRSSLHCLLDQFGFPPL